MRQRPLVILILLGMTGMFGFAYALVPLYRVFCELTGFNGKTADSAVATPTYIDSNERQVNLELIANVNIPSPWGFRPSETKIEMQLGRSYTLDYIAENPTDRPVTIKAVPSVAPSAAAQHVKKIECFCFTRQRFEPHERRVMPLQLVIDPALPDEIGTLSLAYTLFEIEQPDKE